MCDDLASHKGLVSYDSFEKGDQFSYTFETGMFKMTLVSGEEIKMDVKTAVSFADMVLYFLGGDTCRATELTPAVSTNEELVNWLKTEKPHLKRKT